MSSYNGVDLFGSGPHRLVEGRRGQVLLSELGFSPPLPGTSAIGLGEVNVTVIGRLRASTEAGLWALRDAIVAQLTSPPGVATLADGRGRTWTGISLVQFRVGDRVDRGREWSVSYRARFIRFRVPQG